ncbi:MAG: class II D-tagatose-bisphosphate aldolase, non-catalytic subunit [Firmicutes bacterium]|nr:class II D-tagatose-bisphosphate aldolase, non-catalytic subunit [Bacillota bacterium]
MEYVHHLQTLVQQQKKGIHEGICSVCSSSPFVIDAAITQAVRTGTPVLIEATANQVNQMGGYTGMKPADFREYVLGRAAALGLPAERLILGGDHLGPVAWQKRDAAEAMDLAEELTYEFAKAGFTKIHLDASMPLGEEITLSTEEIADRTVRLCKASERGFAAYRKDAVLAGAASDEVLAPVYVIGSEVPTPGGSGEEDALSVTKPEALKEMLTCFEEKFKAAGLADGEGSPWERIIAAVVQPGVEFGNDNVHEYVPEEATQLTEEAAEIPNIVLEGHSTDYQRESSLKQMVEDGIAILKVGPALTFAAREGLYALAMMEQELSAAGALEGAASEFIDVLDNVMQKDPSSWQGHYTAEEPESTLLRKYSYSDRSRYYMHRPEVKAAIGKLMENLHGKITLTMLSQFMPQQYVHVREGMLEPMPEALVIDKTCDELSRYWRACGLFE